MREANSHMTIAVSYEEFKDSYFFPLGNKKVCLMLVAKHVQGPPFKKIQ